MKMFSELLDSERNRYIELAGDCVCDLLKCKRDWAAWGYNAMTQDAFVAADEDDQIVTFVATLIYNFVQNLSEE